MLLRDELNDSQRSAEIFSKFGGIPQDRLRAFQVLSYCLTLSTTNWKVFLVNLLCRMGMPRYFPRSSVDEKTRAVKITLLISQ